MLTRLIGFFRRYLATHLVLGTTPGAIRDPAGQTVGHVSGVVWTAGRLDVRGNLVLSSDEVDEVTLHLGRMRTATQVRGPNGDFALSLPWPGDLGLLDTVPWLSCARVAHHPLRLKHVRLAIVRVTARFVVTVMRVTPLAARWLRHGDLAARARIKEALGMGLRNTAGPLDGAVLAQNDTQRALSAPPDTSITIVLPVHDAFEMLESCLACIAENTALPWHLIAVDDASSDPRIRPALEAFAAAQPEGRVTVIAQDVNLGFIGSVNAAFAVVLSRTAERTGPVILLNSDAMVPPGWAARLVAPLLDDPTVASVTPMSNDAEICSVPAICQRGDLAPDQAKAIDQTAAGLTAAAQAEAPTGVGFCMAMARGFLERLPTFDTVFGRGYGEEVDWCQKARALGGRHLCLGNLFVEHRGGSSFGSDEKRALIARNSDLVARRYPTYDAEVQDFIAADPLRTARMALALAWADSLHDGPLTLYLAHSMGGGADTWLKGRIDAALAEGRAVLVLRVGGPMLWQLEMTGPLGSHEVPGTLAGWSDDFDLIRRLLAPIGALHIVYSCGVGHPDPITLPDRLLALRRGPRDRIEVLFHDYFPVSPGHDLLDAAGKFRGVPAAQGDPKLMAWRQAWGRLLEAADTVRVFSPSALPLIKTVWPDAADRAVVTPHSLPTEVPRLPPPPAGAPPVVGVLGNISFHKGADVLSDLGHMSTSARGFELVLVGNLDPAFVLPRAVTVHGRYDVADIPTLVRHYAITHWLIPSICPETFSFTTHEALATGLPVLAFDIGAQGTAVSQAANGVPVAFDPDGNGAAAIVAAITRSLTPERQPSCAG